MSTRISSRDLERLNAFIDGALTPTQRATLQARLSAESGLARALRELQSMRNILRRAPQRRVPRSFGLTREMAGQRSPARPFSSLSLVSAVAAFALVLVVAGDLLIRGPQLPIAAEMPQALMVAPAAEDAIMTPEETTGAVQDEAEAFRIEEGEDFTAKQEDTDLTPLSFYERYGGPLEFVLALIAVFSGLFAIRERWKQRSSRR